MRCVSVLLFHVANAASDDQGQTVVERLKDNYQKVKAIHDGPQQYADALGAILDDSEIVQMSDKLYVAGECGDVAATKQKMIKYEDDDGKTHVRVQRKCRGFAEPCRSLDEPEECEMLSAFSTETCLCAMPNENEAIRHCACDYEHKRLLKACAQHEDYHQKHMDLAEKYVGSCRAIVKSCKTMSKEDLDIEDACFNEMSRLLSKDWQKEKNHLENDHLKISIKLKEELKESERAHVRVLSEFYSSGDNVLKHLKDLADGHRGYLQALSQRNPVYGTHKELSIKTNPAAVTNMNKLPEEPRHEFYHTKAMNLLNMREERAWRGAALVEPPMKAAFRGALAEYKRVQNCLQSTDSALAELPSFVDETVAVGALAEHNVGPQAFAERAKKNPTGAFVERKHELQKEWWAKRQEWLTDREQKEKKKKLFSGYEPPHLAPVSTNKHGPLMETGVVVKDQKTGKISRGGEQHSIWQRNV